nr:MAG: hypothetical protein [Bacteriophage sp.]
MLSINEQEIFVDDLQEVETKLFNLIKQLGSYDELGRAWLIVYKRLQKEKEKEAKMKSEKLNHC